MHLSLPQSPLVLSGRIPLTNTQDIGLMRQKVHFGGYLTPTVTVTPKFYAFILVPKSLSGKSLVKFYQQICKISC